MPYVDSFTRDHLAPSIDAILAAIEELSEQRRGGALDYVVFKLLRELTRDENYHVQRGYYGDVLWAAAEWYRRFAVPYEDKARQRNGDIT